jgi:hypothetical protein
VTLDEESLDSALRAGRAAPAHGEGFFERLEDGMRTADAELAAGALRERRRPGLLRRHVRLAAAIAAASAAAVVVVIALLGLSPLGGRGIEPASASEAAEVSEWMRTALARAQSLSGRMEFRTEIIASQNGRRDTISGHADFALSANGDLRVSRTQDRLVYLVPAEWEGSITFTLLNELLIGAPTAWTEGQIELVRTAAKRPGSVPSAVRIDLLRTGLAGLTVAKKTDVIVYDAVADRELEYQNHPPIADEPSLRTASVVSHRSGDPAPLLPVVGLPTTQGAMVIAALADDAKAPVENVEYDGRPAWRMSVSRTDGDHASTDEYYVDRDSGVLVCVRRTVTVDGKLALRGEMKVTGLRMNASLPADTFSTEAPAGYPVSRRENQGGRCTLAEASRRLGWVPEEPTSVPAGFALASVSTATLRGRGAANSVTLTYRCGLLGFTVTLGPAGAMDVAHLKAKWKTRPHEATLTTGTFAGATASTWLDPEVGIHLYAERAGRAVHVAGALTRAEALAVTGSLHE